MQAHVRFRLPDGSPCILSNGDVIGRLWSAALHIDDPRVSEAHALVSLRGGTLKLLGLRGMFAVKGKPVPDLVLEPGQEIGLTATYTLVVEAVELPSGVLGIEGDGLVRRALPSGVCSLLIDPRPRLVPRFLQEAAATIWSTGLEWKIQIDGEVRELLEGMSWVVGERSFRAVTIPLTGASRGVTVVEGGVHTPLKIKALFDTVHIHRPREPALVLTGKQARIVSELVAFDGPVSWEVLAAEVWRDPDRHLLRRKWDVNLARLRKRLRDARIRSDLIRADGAGNVELLLYDHDVVIDEQ